MSVNIQNFIDDCVSNHFGFIISTKTYPVVFKPEIKNIEYNIENLISQTKEIVIDCGVIKDEFINSFKEYIRPLIIHNSIFKIKIYIHNKEQVKQISQIIDIYINYNNVSIIFVVKYAFMNDNQILLKEIEKLGITYEVIIDDVNINQDIISNNNRVRYNIRNISEYNTIKNILLKNNNVTAKPYFDKNIDFFKEYVFLDDNDIDELSPTMTDVIKNKYLNVNFFGKLYIKTNGDVFSNRYSIKLGNIFYNTIFDTLKSEVENKNGWFITREMVLPCKDCIFNIICPPISDYEYILNQFNLCKINNK